MRWSQYFIPTLREDPADAEIVSHKLLLRAGMIRKIASGIYTFLPLGFKVLKKIEEIVRNEMNKMGAIELLLPLVQPAELWKESGRWESYGKELLRFKDRKEHYFCLGPTHEEVITEIVRKDVKSYKDLPLILYQIAVKFRDEIRPRFGIMRAREFIMKDAYSFDADWEGLEKNYQNMYSAYSKIFQKCGLKFKVVEAYTGAIGGDVSHEFMVLAETGEDILVVCENCKYASNIELAPAILGESYKEEKEKPLEKVYTPGVRTAKDVAEYLNMPLSKITKTLIYVIDEKEFVAVCLRGDHEVNEVKLEKLFPSKRIRMATEEEIKKEIGASPGFLGPKGLKMKVIVDKALVGYPNFVIGANENEFHFINVNLGRDFEPDLIEDVRKACEGDRCPKCGASVNLIRGIEVGHIFKLGTKYSKSMKATFLDKDGKAKPFIMGCYGIGISRIIAASIEQNHDNNGIIFPWNISPFQIVITFLKQELKEEAEKIYYKLLQKWDVILDDRDERPGVKFKDFDLIGFPLQIILGKTFEAENKVEIKIRKTGERIYIHHTELEEYIQKLSSQL